LISLGELIFGALKSSRPNENRENLRERLLEFRLIAPDRSTAEIYGEVSLKLRRKGRPIPDNDIWIASIALQHDLSFLTRDSHFREVDGLNLLEW
jgi:tRNA(fMet)-specific endonuclease VapC